MGHARRKRGLTFAQNDALSQANAPGFPAMSSSPGQTRALRVLVIGAGPAGLAAARALTDASAAVVGPAAFRAAVTVLEARHRTCGRVQPLGSKTPRGAGRWPNTFHVSRFT